jgi:hypothetical protein
MSFLKSLSKLLLFSLFYFFNLVKYDKIKMSCLVFYQLTPKVMSEKTYTRDEVVELLTEIVNLHFKMLCDKTSCFPWEKDKMTSCPKVHYDEQSMYGDIYGKVMSLIEATADKEKVESTKTLARQLLSESQKKWYIKIYNNFCDVINENKDDVSGAHYFIAEKLSK